MRDRRQDLRGKVLYDLVGVSEREQTGQGPAAGHAITPRVVDDDKVDAGCLFTLCGDARAGPTPDDRPAVSHLLAESCQDQRSRLNHLLALPTFVSFGSTGQLTTFLGTPGQAPPRTRDR